MALHIESRSVYVCAIIRSANINGKIDICWFNDVSHNHFMRTSDGFAPGIFFHFWGSAYSTVTI